MKEYKWKGSLTVEASFIIPISILIIFGLIYLMFTQYDEVMIRNEIRRNCYMAVCQDIEKEKWEQDMTQNLQKKLFLTKLRNIHVEKWGSNVSIRVEETKKIIQIYMELTNKREKMFQYKCLNQIINSKKGE